MTNLTIKSQKGAEIMLSCDESGFVTADVNGRTYNGTHKAFGVQMFGSNQGDYIQLTTGGAALVALTDVKAAKDFFSAARKLADAVARDSAEVQHKKNMQDPAYAARVFFDRLTADMDRADSKY